MSLAVPSATAERSVMVGIGCTTLAYALFTGHDTLIKLLTETITVWQIMFFRSLTICVGTAIMGRGTLLRSCIATRAKGQLIMRGFLILGAWLCYYNAAKTLQLAELTTIYFATPVLVTLLAVPILNERINNGRWIPVAVGFGGVIVASGLTSFTLSYAVGLAFCAAVLWSWATILVRKLARSEPTLVQMMYSNLFFVVVCGLWLTFIPFVQPAALAIGIDPALLSGWHAPTQRELVLLIGVGVVGGLAQFCMFEGLRHAPASVLAPFQYSSLVWAFLLGWLVWGDWPRDEVFVGAAIILASGALAIWQQKSRPAR